MGEQSAAAGTGGSRFGALFPRFAEPIAPDLATALAGGVDDDVGGRAATTHIGKTPTRPTPTEGRVNPRTIGSLETEFADTVDSSEPLER